MISTRKTEGVVEIVKLISMTYIVALYQAVDLQCAEENFKVVVKKMVSQSSRKNTNELQVKSGYWEKKLIDVIEEENVFKYIDNTCGLESPLI